MAEFFYLIVNNITDDCLVADGQITLKEKGELDITLPTWLLFKIVKDNINEYLEPNNSLLNNSPVQ
jgi:hypothetical protein